MKTVACFLWTFALIATHCPLAAAEEPEHPPANANAAVPYQKFQVRELQVTLADENGKPVKGATVELYGMERFQRWPNRQHGEKEANNPWWTFTTDAQGKLLARFAIPPKDNTWNYDNLVPHHGRFYFVAEMPDGRRGVSVPVFHAVTRTEAENEEANEWESDSDRKRIFTDETRELTMQLERGRTISGVMVTPKGQPLPGRKITAVHDLHIGSRTGFGGEIFKVEASTDEKGQFELRNVHPIHCTLELDGDGHWSRTQVTLKTPKEGEGTTRWIESAPRVAGLPIDISVSLKIEIAPNAPAYRYFGKVTDAKGRGLPGLIVSAGISFNEVPKTYADFHHVRRSTTDDSGHWTLEAGSPWVTFFSVTAEPHGKPLYSESYEYDRVGLAAPGEYNFTLKAR